MLLITRSTLITDNLKVEHRHPTDDLHRQTRVNTLYDRRKAHLKTAAFSEIGKPGRVQVQTKKATRRGNAPQSDIKPFVKRKCVFSKLFRMRLNHHDPRPTIRMIRQKSELVSYVVFPRFSCYILIHRFT